jgi:hypothetical protein
VARAGARQDGVDLDEAAGVVGLEALGQAHGMAAAGRPAAGAGLAAQAGHGLYGAAGDQMGDDAAHRGVGDGEALGSQERPELGAAPIGLALLSRSTACTSSLVQVLGRRRCGRRERGSARLCQR